MRLRPSANGYDWLGSGIYFWEANPRRAVDFGREVKRRDLAKIKMPAVVGAVIDLGVCLDLTTSAGVEEVRRAHRQFVRYRETAELPRLVNGKEFWRRNLDCGVIDFLRDRLAKSGLRIDTVRAPFIEGRPIYETSGFFTKTHIQICVVNPDSLKGVFRVPAHTMRQG